MKVGPIKTVDLVGKLHKLRVVSELEKRLLPTHVLNSIFLTMESDTEEAFKVQV